MNKTLLLFVKDSIQNSFPEINDFDVAFEKPKRPEHGDLALNVAMNLAKKLGQNPRAIAQTIVDKLPEHPAIEKVSIAGPGFINIHLSQRTLSQLTHGVAQNDPGLFSFESKDADKKVYMEYVSANPTGPLHVGHGRAAVIGSAIGRLLKMAGRDVTQAYFVNDAGLQIDTLTCSVILRLVEQNHEDGFNFPEFFYQGDYIKDIAHLVKKEHIPMLSLEKINHILAQTDKAKELLQNEIVDYLKENSDKMAYDAIKSLAVEEILDHIRQDLGALNVSYDEWVYESSLLEDGTVAKCLDHLTNAGHIYEKDDAKWFRSSNFSDDKDRVVIRSNGVNTYFMNDVAYHYYKFNRVDEVINLMGSDHHGYGPRLDSVRQALAFNDKSLAMYYIQFAVLWRGGEKVSMSTRSAQFVPLKELYELVGVGPTLFFYAMKKPDQHLDFDLDLALKKSNENPYFYVQYAHARISQLLLKTTASLSEDTSILDHPAERSLMVQLYYFQLTLERACLHMEPHLICFYLIDLAKLLHAYYAEVKILDDSDTQRMGARLYLLKAVQNMLARSLGILGITPADKM